MKTLNLFDTRPCVDFDWPLHIEGQALAHVTMVDGTRDRKDFGGQTQFFSFELAADCIQEICEILTLIWPDWYDYTQWMAKHTEREQAERDAEAELVRQGMAY
jgi:hypothetical protein